MQRRYAEMLDSDGLPRFDHSDYDPETNTLRLTWNHGLTFHIDVTADEIEPFDEEDKRAILGFMPWEEPIHVTVPGSPEDPRSETSIPGVIKHCTPALQPDDVTVHNGIPVTSPSRTLIDLAEVLDEDELREAFARARELGLLDADAIRASRARVEWRPSLAVLDEVIDEFCGER